MGLNNTLTNEDVENLRRVNLNRLEEIVKTTGQNNIKSPRHTLSNSVYNLPLTGAPLNAPGAPKKKTSIMSRIPSFFKIKRNKPMRTRKANRKSRKTRKTQRR